MGVEYKDITRETLTKERPDLVAVLTGTDEHTRLTEEATAAKTKLAEAETELTRLRAVEAGRLREQEIAAELTAAKFPTADPVLYSGTFKEQLALATDKTARGKLIADRMALAAGRLQEGRLPPPNVPLTDPNANAPHGDPSMDHLFGKA